MLAQVVSKDGDVLYTRVQANQVSIAETERQLRVVAQTRTSTDLLADEYYPTADEAAAVRRPGELAYGRTIPADVPLT